MLTNRRTDSRTSRRTTFLVPAAVLATLALGTGCETTPGYKSGKHELGSSGRMTETSTGDAWLCQRVQIRNTRGKRLQDNRLHVEFDLFNSWYDDINFQYAITWLDSDGMLVSSGDYYEQASIPSEESMTVRLDAPTVDASQWQIDLQRIR